MECCLCHHPAIQVGWFSDVYVITPHSVSMVELLFLYLKPILELVCILMKHDIHLPPSYIHKYSCLFPDFHETTLQFQEDLYMFGDVNIHLDLPAFMAIDSTCVLLDLLALTSRQYFLHVVYQITSVSLLICGYKSGQELKNIKHPS